MNVSGAVETTATIATSATASSTDAVLRTRLSERRVLVLPFDAPAAQPTWLQVIEDTEDVTEAADTAREALIIPEREAESGALPTIRVVPEDELLPHYWATSKPPLHAP